MIEADRLIAAAPVNPQEEVLDRTLRPRALDEYIGQEKIRGQFSIFIEPGKKRKEPPDHGPLFGPPRARSVKLDLQPFTLVGATTRAGMLTNPLRDRFGIVARLEFYTAEELTRIVTRSARLLEIAIDPDGAVEIARRSRGTPRIANRLLRRVRDFAEVRAAGHITRAVADAALKMLDVDGSGLDVMDRKLLQCVLEKFGGGPVGIDNLAAAIGEERDTIEDVLEPYLIQQGFLQRTTRGRVATPLSYRHFGIVPPAAAGELFTE